jgi:hypothetical protein
MGGPLQERDSETGRQPQIRQYILNPNKVPECCCKYSTSKASGCNQRTPLDCSEASRTRRRRRRRRTHPSTPNTSPPRPPWPSMTSTSLAPQPIRSVAPVELSSVGLAAQPALIIAAVFLVTIRPLYCGGGREPHRPCKFALPPGGAVIALCTLDGARSLKSSSPGQPREEIVDWQLHYLSNSPLQQY